MIAKRRPSGPCGSERGSEQGYVLVTMTVASFALLGAVGMAVDMGKLFITKTETQAFCDAAALAAAGRLNGATTGIANANAAVTATGNTWNFNTQTVSSPTVTYSILSTGPWVANPNPAAGYVYAKVQTAVTPTVYFVPLILATFGQSVNYTQTVNSYAIAGQVALTTFPKGLAPYTAVSTITTGPNFGLTPGTEYTLQWPSISAGNGCDSTHPNKCFNGNFCAGESDATKWAVVQDWGSNTEGYWGYSSNSDIRAAVLDDIQLEALAVGTNIAPVLSNGDKNEEATILDVRASEDRETSNNYATYLASSTHNGRRMIVVPVINPTSTTSSIVSGYGSFLLYSNGTNASPTSDYYKKKTNGNDAYCAIYAGPYAFGSTDPGGAGGGTGAYRIKLVE